MNRWSPLAGVLLGAAGASVMHFLTPVAGGWTAAAVTAVLWTLLAGDVRRECWKAAPALCAARCVALAYLAVPVWFLVAAQTAPRSAAIVLAYVTRPRDHRDTDGLRAWHVAAALAVAGLAAASCGLRFGWFQTSCCIVLLIVVRAWAESTVGGAGSRHRRWLERAAECVILTTAACARCQW